MANIKVSVIIPAYNAEKYIEKSINSILNQTYKSFEIIIVDDGSTDRTIQLLQKFSKDITLIKQKNAGASAARNTAIKAAQGQYISFLDADDIWHPLKLEIQCREMEKNPDWVASHTKVSRNEKLDFAVELYPSIKSQSLKQVFAFPYFTTSTFLIKKDLLDKLNGFDENLNTAEDIDLYLKASIHGLIGEIDETLAYKRDVVGSLGSDLSSYADNLSVIDNFMTNNKDSLDNTFLKIEKIIKAHVYERWGENLLWRGESREACKIFVTSLKFKFTYKVLYFLFKSIIKFLLQKVSVL